MSISTGKVVMEGCLLVPPASAGNPRPVCLACRQIPWESEVRLNRD